MCNGALGDVTSSTAALTPLEAAGYLGEGKADEGSSTGDSPTPASTSGGPDSSDGETLANGVAADGGGLRSEGHDDDVKAEDADAVEHQEAPVAQLPLLADPLHEFHAVHARCLRKWRNFSAERKGCRIAEMKSELASCKQLLERGASRSSVAPLTDSVEGEADEDPVVAMKVKMELYRQILAKRQQQAPQVDPPRAEGAQDPLAAMRTKMKIWKQILAGRSQAAAADEDHLQHGPDQQRLGNVSLGEQPGAAMVDKLSLWAQLLRHAPARSQGMLAAFGETPQDDGSVGPAALSAEVCVEEASWEARRAGGAAACTVCGPACGPACGAIAASAGLVAAAAAAAAVARAVAAARRGT